MMSKDERDWPFPSLDAFTISIPGKGNALTISGNPKEIESYLKRFGCVPVYFGTPRRRKLARWESGGWKLFDPDGTTELEAPTQRIDGDENQRAFLVERNWYLVGYNAHRTLVEFAFDETGEGFSRYASWGDGTKVPAVHDYYWRFLVVDGAFEIEWEDEGSAKITFTLNKTLHVAGSLADGSVAFYDSELLVNGQLFPPSAEFAKGFLKDYWGKPNYSVETPT